MNRKLTIAMTFCLLLGLAPTLSAAPRGFVRPAFGYGWNHGPWYSGPRVIVETPATGGLKLKTNDKDARVYLDGGYLGIASHLKKFDLMPGKHDIQLRNELGGILFDEEVAILPNRTTEVDAMGIAG